MSKLNTLFYIGGCLMTCLIREVTLHLKKGDSFNELNFFNPKLHKEKVLVYFGS